MKKIEFDLELAKKITSGEMEGKIRTRTGKEARIICFDKHTNSNLPLIVLIKECNEYEDEDVYHYHADGTSSSRSCSLDLVIEIPEKMQPFDRVLVRQYNNDYWSCGIFSHYTGEYFVANSVQYYQCIPYEGNEKLLGTINKPDHETI